jgi:hypothetical protein
MREQIVFRIQSARNGASRRVPICSCARSAKLNCQSDRVLAFGNHSIDRHRASYSCDRKPRKPKIFPPEEEFFGGRSISMKLYASIERQNEPRSLDQFAGLSLRKWPLRTSAQPVSVP